jgi:hypothetical protein
MTAIKARHIYEFLQPFSPEELAEPAQTTSAPTEQDTMTSEKDSSVGAAHVVQRATRAMGEVITVLLSPEASQFRSRLLRVLGQFAQCAESLATDAPHLSEEQQAQAIRRLRRAVKSLSEITGSGAADRKAQGRVADSIEELTAKLAECRLSL